VKRPRQWRKGIEKKPAVFRPAGAAGEVDEAATRDASRISLFGSRVRVFGFIQLHLLLF
jgi:hypothetical protein